MATFTRHLRLLLIFAIVLTPVQPLFAMSAGDPMAQPMNVMVTTNMATAAVGDIVQHDMSQMPDEDCNKQGKCSNCLGASHCSSCPLSLGVPHVITGRIELNAQVQRTVPDVSLHSADLSPDYRPPR